MSCFELLRPLELIVLRKAVEYPWSFHRIHVSDISAETEMANSWHRAFVPLLKPMAGIHVDDIMFSTEPQNPLQ